MRGLNGFKNLKQDLPQEIISFIEENNGFKYPGSWYYDISFIKGNDFIVTTDDGCFYKVGAQFMIWAKINGKTHCQAIWSMAALKRSLKSLMLENKTIFDPNYQT